MGRWGLGRGGLQDPEQTKSLRFGTSTINTSPGRFLSERFYIIISSLKMMEFCLTKKQSLKISI